MSENDLNKYHKSDKYASFILSIVALVVAGIALAVSIPRCLKKDCNDNVDLGIDYLGIIIGLLALMVTLMVAWNIWQTMEAKRTMERFDDKVSGYDEDLETKVNSIKDGLLNEVKRLQNETKNDIELSEAYNRGKVVSELYEHILHFNNNFATPYNDSLYNFLYHSIRGLWVGVNNGDVAYCKLNLNAMFRWLETAQKMHLTDTQISELHEELNKLKPKLSSVKRFNEFTTRFCEVFPLL